MHNISLETQLISSPTGVLTIFVWRIAAKSFSHMVLPPTFRLLSHLFTLPHRRFYTPATDYTSVPAEKGLRPIPSVIDLPNMVEYEVDGVGLDAAAAASSARRSYGATALTRMKNRKGARLESDEKAVGRGPLSMAGQEDGDDESDPAGKDVKHYDADGEWCASSYVVVVSPRIAARARARVPASSIAEHRVGG